jgi:hypothetical protein
MSNYLGETIVDISNTEFKNYKKHDWVLYFISKYGGIDGADHKDWVLDQIARISNNTKLIIKIAKWDNDEQEYRIELDSPSKKYYKWIKDITENDKYYYKEGVAP